MTLKLYHQNLPACDWIGLMIRFTAIVTAHKEGPILLSALKSIKRNFNQSPNVKFEILISLDRANNLTAEIAKDFAKNDSNIKIIHHDYGDVGLSRQSTLKFSSFDYAAFLDGDDLWGDFWIKSVRQRIQRNPEIIWHPDLTLYFDDDLRLVRKNINGNSVKFRKEILIFENLWTSTFVTPTHIMEKVPMQGGDTYNSVVPYAYEDWSWFRDTVAMGYRHGVAKKTVNFVRLKSESNTTRSLILKKLPWPTDISNLIY